MSLPLAGLMLLSFCHLCAVCACVRARVCVCCQLLLLSVRLLWACVAPVLLCAAVAVAVLVRLY